MGVDLVGLGYTVNPNVEWDVEALTAVIEGMTFPEAMEDGLAWDGQDLVMLDTLEEDLDQEDLDDHIRGQLLSGLDVAHEITAYRLSTWFQVGDNPNRVFLFAGGGSFGDEPFDGFGSLELFLSAVEFYPELKALTPFVGFGIVVD